MLLTSSQSTVSSRTFQSAKSLSRVVWKCFQKDGCLGVRQKKLALRASYGFGIVEVGFESPLTALAGVVVTARLLIRGFTGRQFSRIHETLWLNSSIARFVDGDVVAL